MGIAHYQTHAQQRWRLTVKPADSHGHLVHSASGVFLLHAEDHTGHLAYYFLQVPPLRLPQFKKAIEGSGAVDLEIYGDILASGYGEAPEALRRQYNITP